MTTFNGTNLSDILNGTTLADLIFGNGGNDTLRGHSGDDVIRAGLGDDILEGGAGNDILFADGGSNSLVGGEGSDILVSGSGSDHFNGGTDIDAASWQNAAFGVVANLGTGRAVSGGVSDTLAQVENLIGSRFADDLRGDTARNELFGGNGNDRLYGEGGSDRLSGGNGNDLLDGGEGINNLRGGAGIDTASYLGASGGVDVDLAGGWAFGGGRHEGLGEIEAVRGSTFDDTIVGNAAANTLSGDRGHDTIDGGEGNDLLSGGSGTDSFVFKAIRLGQFGTPGFDAGHDVITDFGSGDHIDLRGHFEATSFAALKAGASQFGEDTVLRLGDDTIRIEGVGLEELSAAMFLF